MQRGDGRIRGADGGKKKRIITLERMRRQGDEQMSGE